MDVYIKQCDVINPSFLFKLMRFNLQTTGIKKLVLASCFTFYAVQMHYFIIAFKWVCEHQKLMIKIFCSSVSCGREICSLTLKEIHFLRVYENSLLTRDIGLFKEVRLLKVA